MASAAEGLAAIEGVTLYGDPPDRVPTLMFNVAGHTSTEVAAALAEREIAVWQGNYYAWELERFLGLDPEGAVRAGFVHYNDADDARRLVEAVRMVGEGSMLLGPGVTRRLVEDFGVRRDGGGDPLAGTSLTPREREVLVLLGRGWSNAEIAESMVVATETVKSHVAEVLRKLGLRDRVQAVVYAYRSGLVT